MTSDIFGCQLLNKWSPLKAAISAVIAKDIKD
jgi:hypothetical protein